LKHSYYKTGIHIHSDALYSENQSIMGNDNIPIPDLVSDSDSECECVHCECHCDYYEMFEDAIHKEMGMSDTYIPFSVCLFDHDEITNKYELYHEIKKMTAEIHNPFVEGDDPMVVDIVDNRSKFVAMMNDDDEYYVHHLIVRRPATRPISLKDVLVAMATSEHYKEYTGDHRFLEGFDVIQRNNGYANQYFTFFGS
jgi:hypothetical protein